MIFEIDYSYRWTRRDDIAFNIFCTVWILAAVGAYFGY